ncbi:MAG: hypothetical protein AAB620_00375 [Patescibacteria group bacterium]
MEKQDKFSELFAAIKKWHTKTPADRRTIDNLRRHLASAKIELPLNENDRKTEDCAEQMNVQFLVGYLISQEMSFQLTALTVDAFLRPTAYDIEMAGYQFFLEHFDEHPLLEKKILKGLNKPLRLRVQPVIPADDNLMCWFFDPWETKAYTLRVNWGKQYLKRIDEKIKSTSAFSIFAEYQGSEHPFSEAYQERIKQFVEFRNALNGA